MIGGLVFVGLIGLIGYGVFRKKPSIEDDPMGRLLHTETVAIGDAPEVGPVKVVGRASPIGRALVAPFSRRECVYYRFVIEELLLFETGFHDENGRPVKGWEWTPRAAETRHMDFKVQDETGVVRVAGETVSFEVDADQGRREGQLDALTAEQVEWLERNGFELDAAFKARRLRYREFCIEKDEMVAVRGMPEWEADPGGATGPYREMAARRMVFEGHRVLVSDKPETLE